MKLSPQQVQILTDYFRDKPVTAVYLFGSYARGDADGESDIDVMLEIDLNTPFNLNISNYKKELLGLLSIQTDIFLQHQILKYAKTHIWNERLLLYKK